MMISPGVFFHVFDSFFFQAVRGVKVQKMDQDDQKTLSGGVDIS